MKWRPQSRDSRPLYTSGWTACAHSTRWCGHAIASCARRFFLLVELRGDDEEEHQGGLTMRISGPP